MSRRVLFFSFVFFFLLIVLLVSFSFGSSSISFFDSVSFSSFTFVTHDVGRFDGDTLLFGRVVVGSVLVDSGSVLVPGMLGCARYTSSDDFLYGSFLPFAVVPDGYDFLVGDFSSGVYDVVEVSVDSSVDLVAYFNDSSGVSPPLSRIDPSVFSEILIFERRDDPVGSGVFLPVWADNSCDSLVVEEEPVAVVRISYS